MLLPAHRVLQLRGITPQLTSTAGPIVRFFGMILFVDAEHEQGFDKPWGEFLLAGRTRITYRLEDISGDTCLLQRYTKINPDLIAKHRIRAMFISGSGTDPEFYEPAQREGLREPRRSTSHREFLSMEWNPLTVFKCGRADRQAAVAPEPYRVHRPTNGHSEPSVRTSLR